jgi:small acid-soluble spore protein F (minor alpha/beta-type SASP)
MVYFRTFLLIIKFNTIGRSDFMSSKKRILSDESKSKIADELGINQDVEKDGWGEMSSKNCGDIVKNVIENVIKKQINKEDSNEKFN